MSETTEITTLDGGLRVATETMASVQTVSVGVWIDVGARYEAPEVNGVAHMLEHMAFKGTARRSARAIAEAIENVGGQLNAYTSREHTAYYARVLADDLPLAVECVRAADRLSGVGFLFIQRIVVAGPVEVDNVTLARIFKDRAIRI